MLSLVKRVKTQNGHKIPQSSCAVQEEAEFDETFLDSGAFKRLKRCFFSVYYEHLKSVNNA